MSISLSLYIYIYIYNHLSNTTCPTHVLFGFGDGAFFSAVISWNGGGV